MSSDGMEPSTIWIERFNATGLETNLWIVSVVTLY